jgi:hypothetical protein
MSASEATGRTEQEITIGPDGAAQTNISSRYLSIPHKNKYGHDYPADSGDPAYPGSKP